MSRDYVVLYTRLMQRKHVGTELLNRLGPGLQKEKSFHFPWTDGATLKIHHWYNQFNDQHAFHVIHTAMDGTESNTIMNQKELFNYMGKPQLRSKKPMEEEYPPADIFNYIKVKDYKPRMQPPPPPKVG